MHHLLQMFFGHPRYFAFRLFVVLSVTWYCWVRCLNPHYRSENKFMLFGVAVAFASKINFDGLEHSPRIVTDFGDGTVLTGGARVLDSLILLSAGLAVYACRQAVLKLERPLNYVAAALWLAPCFAFALNGLYLTLGTVYQRAQVDTLLNAVYAVRYLLFIDLCLVPILVLGRLANKWWRSRRQPAQAPVADTQPQPEVV